MAVEPRELSDFDGPRHVRVDRWTLPNLSPKVLVAQLDAQYVDTKGTDDQRIRHVEDDGYLRRLLSMLQAQREHQAQFLVFPEYAWPFRAARTLRDEVQKLPDGMAAIVPFEHLTLLQVRELTDLFGVDADLAAELIRDVCTGIPENDRTNVIANVAFSFVRADGRTRAIPQAKIRCAGLEEDAVLGRWRFGRGRRTVFVEGTNCKFAVAICFDFVARDAALEVRTRDAVRDEGPHFLFVPECNPSPLHVSGALGISELLEDPRWKNKPRFLCFVNVGSRTRLWQLKKQHFGYSRLAGPLGRTQAPLADVFLVHGGVLSCDEPKTLKTLASIQASAERLSIVGMKTVVVRPQESLIAFVVPLSGADGDPAVGRVNTEINVHRIIRPENVVRSIRCAAILPTLAPFSFGVPRGVISTVGLVGFEALHQELSSLVEGRGPVWVYGPGGGGKTALVADFCERRSHHTRIIWLDMERIGSSVDALQEALLIALQGIAELEERGEKERWAVIKQRLSERPTIVVLDSYEKAFSKDADAKLPPELAATDGWSVKIIVTSREEPADDIGASTLDVRPLSTPQVGHLVSLVSSQDIDEPTAKALSDLLRGSPLGCTWVGAVLREDPSAIKKLLAAKLSDDLQALFKWSTNRLGRTEQDVLSVLCALPAPMTAADLSLAIGGVELGQVESALDALEGKSLTVSEDESSSPRRFRPRHPFVRQFWRAGQGDASLPAHVTSWAGDLLKNHGGDRNWRQYARLQEVWPNVKHVLKWLAGRETDDQRNQFLEMWRLVDYFLWTKGHYRERIEMGSLALEIAKKVGDELSQAHALFDSIAETEGHLSAQLASVLAKMDEAEALYRRHLDTKEAARGLVLIDYYRSRFLRKDADDDRAKLEKALEKAETAVNAARALGDDGVLGTVLNGCGNIHRALGDPAAADKKYREALRLLEKQGDEEMVAVVHRNLGRVANRRKDYAAALDELEEAMHAFVELGYPSEIAEAAGYHAEALAGIGECEEARRQIAAVIDAFSSQGSAKRVKEYEAIKEKIERLCSSGEHRADA